MMCCVVAVQNEINALVVFIASASAASVSLLLVRIVARVPPKIDNGSGG
jgi:energy-converting hydrogenase Eha subunit E